MRIGYLFIMVSIIAIITLISIPPLFFPKCKFCGRRNNISRVYCKHCNKRIEQDYISMLEKEQHFHKD
jgi:formate dehydrogenase maturation protein FdhE